MARPTSCQVETVSRNSAVFAYNYHAISDFGLIRPLPDNGIVFEVTPEGGETMRVGTAFVIRKCLVWLGGPLWAP